MEECSTLIACAGIAAPKIFEALFALVALASGVAAMTPTPADNKITGRLYRVLDLLALNVGYAKEKSKSAGGRFVAN